MKIRELNSIDELNSLAAVWRSLLQQTPNASFFQSLDWLEAYWSHFGGDQQLRVLVVESEHQVVGILPLVRKKESTRLGELSFLTYPMDYWGSFYGPIGPRPFEILAEGINYLSEKGTQRDVLELRWVADDQGQCEHTYEILKLAGFSPTASHLDSTAVINLPETWEDYLASRTSKWRNNLRRWQRKLNELGEVTYFRFRPQADSSADPGWEHYEECLRIAEASWQGNSTTGTTLTHQEVSAFLRDAHRAAARAGCVDINLLLLDGRAIAFAYNYVFQGHIFGLRIGYDAAIPCKGVGNLLYAKTIEESIRRGDWRYDMGPRHIEIKRSLMTDELPVYRLSCYNSLSMRQQIMRLKRCWDNRQTELVEFPGGEAAKN